MYAADRQQVRAMTPPFWGSTVNNETRASESATTGARGPSRRTLVRTAAWSVPVISTSAAAPAFAAFSDTLAFSPGETPSWDGTKKVVDVPFAVVNNSSTDAAQALEVNLTVSPIGTVAIPVPGAWSVVSVIGTSVKLSCASVAKSTASPFTLRFTYGSANRTVVISGTVKTASDFNPQEVSLVPGISTTAK